MDIAFLNFFYEFIVEKILNAIRIAAGATSKRIHVSRISLMKYESTPHAPKHRLKRRLEEVTSIG